MSIVIVGAGAAGLMAAQCLQAAGREVLVLDKGRGPGGRMASRRTAYGVFDHGVGSFALEAEASRRWAAAWQSAGVLAASGDEWTGLPRMAALPRHMATGLALHCGLRVSAIEADATVHSEDGREWPAQAVVITVPPPQALALLPEAAADCHAALAGVRYAPCFSLMVALRDAPRQVPAARAPLDVIRREADRPGRAGDGCWVAHASGAWSARHIEAPVENVTARLLAVFCEQLGVAESAVRFAQLHRWRYARVATPVGRSFLRSGDGPIVFAGDGIAGDGVAAALHSGEQAARSLLDEPPQAISASPE